MHFPSQAPIRAPCDAVSGAGLVIAVCIPSLGQQLGATAASKVQAGCDAGVKQENEKHLSILKALGVLRIWTGNPVHNLQVGKPGHNAGESSQAENHMLFYKMRNVQIPHLRRMEVKSVSWV